MYQTYDEIRRAAPGLDAQDRAHLKHLIRCRDKWIKEAEGRAEIEQSAGINGGWSASARDHAEKLGRAIDALIQKSSAVRK